MTDLISRQAAIDAVASYLYKVCLAFHSCMTHEESKECATLILQSVPSATQSNDSNVLKCVECMHWKGYAVTDTVCWHICEVFDWFSEEEDFCSCAERKEGDGNV